MEKLEVNQILEEEVQRDSRFMNINVRGDTPANSLGSVIERAISSDKKVTLKMIGVKSINQGIKACIIAGKFLAVKGIKLLMLPKFEEVEDVNSHERIVRISVQAIPISSKELRERGLI